MPVYFFGLPDDLASPEVSEELANDAEAKRVAQIVANDLSRDRRREQVAVLVFNTVPIHKVWTWAAGANKTLFPEHVHPKGFYQIEGALERPTV